MMHNWWKNIVTLGPIGYLKAPGTMGSLCAIPLVMLLYSLKLDKVSTALMVTALTLITLKLIDLAMPIFNYQDSSHIIIDEVLGMVYTFWSIPFTIKTLVTGFILFRIFDITKLFGIRYLEKKVPNPTGILIDDIAAGFLANISLYFLTTYNIL